MFIHQAGPQALVQYNHLYDCIKAKGELEKTTFTHNGRRYSFEVQYSKLKELVIHKNNNYSRDFRLHPMDLDTPSFPYTAPPSHAQSHLPIPLNPTAFPKHDFGYAGMQDLGYPEADSLSSSSQGSPRFYQPLYSKRTPFSLLPSYDSFAPHVMDMGSSSSFYQDLPSSRPSFRRHDSDYSLLSSASSVCNEPFTLSPFPYENETPTYPVMSNTRKYILDGFAEMMPISDIVDYLYGMNIKYAEYKKNMHHYSIIIYGISEWSDAMLVSYLRNNPVNGCTITLRGASELVSNYD